MTNEPGNDLTDKLIGAYERMLKQTHEAMEQTRTHSLPKLHALIDEAREHMIELGELTREEADRVADYLRRDLEDAADYLAETGNTIREWWRFDLELMEQRMLDMFASVADQTSLQLARLAETAHRATRYQAGEITGPGILICQNCGSEAQFVRTSRIEPCGECQGRHFHRRGNTATAAHHHA